MRKITFFLSLLLAFAGAATVSADNIPLTSENGLPGTLAGGQNTFQSDVITSQTAAKVIRLTFFDTKGHNTNADSYKFVCISEFYLQDKDGNEIDLTAANFSTNATEPTGEGPIANICDDNTASGNYWHSAWSAGIGTYHYLQIAVPEDIADLTEFKMKWITRNDNNSPIQMLVTTGTSDEDVAKQATALITSVDGVKSKAADMLKPLQDIYGLVKDAAKYTSNATQSGEGSIANLLDGKYDTYFHSSWSAAKGDYHYLQAELPDLATDFRFFFKKRHNNNNNRPTEILIQGSVDGTTFADVQTINSGLPTTADVISYTSANIHSDVAYKYYRFTVKQTSTGQLDTQQSSEPKPAGYPYFTMSEFYILPGNNTAVDDALAAYAEANAVTYVSTPADIAAVDEKVSDIQTKLVNAIKTVTIKKVYDGTAFETSEVTAVYGTTVTYTDDNVRPGLTCSNPTQKITIGDETVVTFNYVLNESGLPFGLSTVENGEFKNVKWYYLTQRGKYSRYDAADNKVKNGSTERDYLLYKDLFAFEGDPVKGYKIYNYVTGATKVLGGTVANNVHVTMMDDAETERFVLENNQDGNGAFHLVFRKNNTTNGYLNDINSTLGYWTAIDLAKVDAGSTFAFVAVDETAFNEIPANELKVSLDAAIADAQAYGIGTGYNNYSQLDGTESLADAIAAANTFKNGLTGADDETVAQGQALVEKLNTLVAGLTINMPAANSFVRVRCANNNKRLLSDINEENNRLLLANNLNPNSIFYYNNDRLLAYKNGLYVNDKVFDAAGGAGGEVVLADGRNIQKGTYTVKCGGRFLYGAGDVIDSGTTLDNRNGYTWWLEAVDALPVSIGDKQFSTLWTPVALNIPAGVTAYTAKLNGDVLELTEIEGGVIPAETGVVIGGEAADYSFAIAATAETAGVDKGSLTGQANTIAFDATTAAGSVYTLQTVSDTEVGFKKYNGTKLSGFKARLEADATQQVLRMAFGGEATGIEGAATADGREAGAVYDLSGRRVAAPAKGLYIVNGKKVLFK